MMSRTLMLVLVTVATLSVTRPAEAQYRYTDDKGVTKTTQYKLDIPTAYRDAAEWVGPTGIGKPGLSEEARQTKLRDDAYRRIGEADAQLRKYGGSASDKLARNPSRGQPKEPIRKEAPVMCVAGERRVMTGPGHWEINGACGTADPGSWDAR